MDTMISSDSIQLSSSDDEGPSDFEDHPYNSPSEDSDNDNKIVEMDFSVFSMEHPQLTDEDPEDPVTSNQDKASNVAETVELVDHTDRCSRGQCTPGWPLQEAVCCQDRPEVRDLIAQGDCITEQPFFKTQLLDEGGLQHNRLMYAASISDLAKRKNFLDREFDNTLRRHHCYRNVNVVVYGGNPIGFGVRVVAPRCVVTEVRRKYPDPEGKYVGFIPSHDSR